MLQRLSTRKITESAWNQSGGEGLGSFKIWSLVLWHSSLFDSFLKICSDLWLLSPENEWCCDSWVFTVNLYAALVYFSFNTYNDIPSTVNKGKVRSEAVTPHGETTKSCAQQPQWSRCPVLAARYGGELDKVPDITEIGKTKSILWLLQIPAFRISEVNKFI